MSNYFLDYRDRRDLQGILNFISERSISAAERNGERLENAFRALAANPYLGRERPDLGIGLRILTVRPS